MVFKYPSNVIVTRYSLVNVTSEQSNFFSPSSG